MRNRLKIFFVISVVSLFLLSVILTVKYSRQISVIQNITGDWVWKIEEFEKPKYDTESPIITPEPHERRRFLSFTDSTVAINRTEFIPYRIKRNFISNSLIYKKQDSIEIVPRNYDGKFTRIIVSEWDTLHFRVLRENVIEIDNRLYRRLLPKTQVSFDSILFASKGCYGLCPIMSMMIHTDGRVFFHGRKFTEKQGYYSGVLTKIQSESILKKYQQVDFDSIDSEYGRGWVDAHSCSVVLYSEGKKKVIHIGNYDDYEVPVEFGVLIHYLIELYKWVDLEEVSPYKFKDIEEIFPPPPPPPKLKFK